MVGDWLVFCGGVYINCIYGLNRGILMRIIHQNIMGNLWKGFHSIYLEYSWKLTEIDINCEFYGVITQGKP
jgi:hypothetical protein